MKNQSSEIINFLFVFSVCTEQVTSNKNKIQSGSRQSKNVKEMECIDDVQILFYNKAFTAFISWEHLLFVGQEIPL